MIFFLHKTSQQFSDKRSKFSFSFRTHGTSTMLKSFIEKGANENINRALAYSKFANFKANEL